MAIQAKSGLSFYAAIESIEGEFEIVLAIVLWFWQSAA
jgi:hypothetical protein